MAPWETLSHTSGHQNSGLVFNLGPFEAMPRQIPCPPTALRTSGFQIRSFLRAEQRAASQRLSIAFDFFFLLIKILFARRAKGFWESSRNWTTIKPRDLPPCTPDLQAAILFPEGTRRSKRHSCGLSIQKYLLCFCSVFLQHRR